MQLTQPNRLTTVIRLPLTQAEAAELRHRAVLMHMTVEAYLRWQGIYRFDQAAQRGHGRD